MPRPSEILLGTRMVINEFVAFSQLGPMKGSLDPRSFYDRYVRVVRFRESQLDRNPDRRHWRAGAEPERRLGPVWCPGHASRDDGQSDVGLDCRHAALESVHHFEEGPSDETMLRRVCVILLVALCLTTALAQSPRRVIIDTDPGVDDAMAICWP